MVETEKPTPTPTPVVCEPTSIEASLSALKLKRGKSHDVTIQLIGDNDCPVADKEVTVKIDKAGKKCITVSPARGTTEASGAAMFTIQAKKVIGRARVTFKAGSLKKAIIVKVKK